MTTLTALCAGAGIDRLLKIANDGGEVRGGRRVAPIKPNVNVQAATGVHRSAKGFDLADVGDELRQALRAAIDRGDELTGPPPVSGVNRGIAVGFPAGHPFDGLPATV